MNQEEIDSTYRAGDFGELAYLHAPVGLVVTENRIIRDCNLMFARMFGYERDALRDQLFAILYPSQEEFVNIRNRGVKDLRETNAYWDPGEAPDPSKQVPAMGLLKAAAEWGLLKGFALSTMLTTT